LLGYWSEKEFSFAGCVEEDVRNVANTQTVNEVILINRLLPKYFLAYPTTFQTKAFRSLDSIEQSLVLYKVDLDLA